MQPRTHPPPVQPCSTHRPPQNIYECDLAQTRVLHRGLGSYFATDKSSLENVQNFARKTITNQWNSSYSDIRTALNWQTLETRRKITKLKVCYNILNHYSCILSSSFTPHPPDFTLITKLFVPYARTLLQKSHFCINIVSAWNSLPAYMVNSTSPSTFSLVLLPSL